MILSRMRSWSLAGRVLVLVAAAGLLAVAPAAGARGPDSPLLVTTSQVIQSESTGDPIQVDSGTWLLFRTGFAVTDDHVSVLDDITLEIVLDGEALVVETATEDTPEGTILWGYASSHPLDPVSAHTVTYRHLASAAGEDGFGFSWDAGVVFESTATLVVGKLAAQARRGDPFVGGWLATDAGDGSAWAFFIDPAVDGVYLVESYDHGASVCGDPGSRTPGPTGDPTEPVRFAGLGFLDDGGALAWDSAGFYCLDAILGPYRVMQSDLDSDTPPEEDGPVSGSQRLIYDPGLDTLQAEGDASVFHRTRAKTVDELRKIIEKTM
jgi:hypothetical protein